MYKVLLYYKLKKVTTEYAKQFVLEHREVCRALQLKGRILVNEYGMNGTVGGSEESIKLFMQYMDKHPKYKGIDWKMSDSEMEPFPRMKVRYRNEIITSGAKAIVENFTGAKHVNRDTFHKWLVDGEDMIIIDMRNDYEWEVGRFKNAIRPPVRYFREIKENMDYYEKFKDHKVVMYCTGGIRCEPATAYFIHMGYDPKNIFQLEGGIVKYAEKYGNEGYFEGKCFVFDNRLLVDINTSKTAEVVGKCYVCESPSESFINCANLDCNKLMIECNDCQEKLDSCCSEACKTYCAENQQRHRLKRVKVAA